MNNLTDSLIDVIKQLQLPKQNEQNAINAALSELEETGTISNDFINRLLNTALEKSALNIYTPNPEDNKLKQVQMLSIEDSKRLVNRLYSLQNIANQVIAKRLYVETENNKIIAHNSRVETLKALKYSLQADIQILKNQYRLTKTQLEIEESKFFKKKHIIKNLNKQIRQTTADIRTLSAKLNSISQEVEQNGKKEQISISAKWLDEQINQSKRPNS